MSILETEAVVVGAASPRIASRIEWGPVIAGALAAAALAFVLHGFAAAVGISVISSAPTWRDASFALVFLSGLYVLLVALAAYALGGYLAARMRARVGDPLASGDGVHGLLVWALATLLTGVMAFALVSVTPRLAAPFGAGSGPTS